MKGLCACSCCTTEMVRPSSYESQPFDTYQRLARFVFHIVQKAAARRLRQQEQQAYRLARAKPASWAARLNLSFADYAHAGAVVCFGPLNLSPDCLRLPSPAPSTVKDAPASRQRADARPHRVCGCCLCCLFTLSGLRPAGTV